MGAGHLVDETGVCAWGATSALGVVTAGSGSAHGFDAVT